MIPVWLIAAIALLGAVCLALPLHIGMTGRMSAASGGGAAGATDPPKKGRAEGLEPDPPSR